MAARAAEQERAADLGKYAAQFQLGYPSAVLRDMRETAPVEELISIVRSTRPARVYLHNPADKHDTHLAVFVRALEALRSLPADERPDHVYGMEVWRALDWLMPEDKVLFDCSGNIELAERLLRALILRWRAENSTTGPPSADGTRTPRFWRAMRRTDPRRSRTA